LWAAILAVAGFLPGRESRLDHVKLSFLKFRMTPDPTAGTSFSVWSSRLRARRMPLGRSKPSTPSPFLLEETYEVMTPSMRD
jgi:hypothetical protein